MILDLDNFRGNCVMQNYTLLLVFLKYTSDHVKYLVGRQNSV